MKIRWTGIFALGFCGVATFVLASQAFPQTLSLLGPAFGIRYLEENEFTEYSDNGATVVDRYYMTTTYVNPSREIVVSSLMPGRPVVTAVRRVLETTGFILTPVLDLFDKHRNEKAASSEQFVKNGCEYPGLPVVGNEVILNYPTVAFLHSGGTDRRMTLWHAPGLGCLVLKITVEERGSDGRFVVRVVRQATEVKTL